MIEPISAISIAASGITVTTSPDYLLDGLTAGYVLLTLALAVIAFRSLRQTQASLDLTRQQIELNRQLSQEAAAANERHSQATIDTVNKQIAASEVQSQAAIEAVNRQIAASERQAQGALHNQFKPVVVPISQIVPVNEERYPLKIVMTNKGAGVALNMFGIFYTNGSRSNKVYHFIRNYFLVPDGEEGIQFTSEADGIKIRPIDDFYGYPTYPGDMPRKNDRGISNISRLMITYEDIFSHKYFIVFRYYGVPKEVTDLLNEEARWGTIDEPGWEKTDLKRVDRRLDELAVGKG
jgi:hypothetical protein